MSIASEIQRLQGAHTSLNNKGKSLISNNNWTDVKVDQFTTSLDQKIAQMQTWLNGVESFWMVSFPNAPYFNEDLGEIVLDVNDFEEIISHKSMQRRYDNMNTIIIYENKLYALFLLTKIQDSDYQDYLDIKGGPYFDLLGLVSYDTLYSMYYIYFINQSVAEIGPSSYADIDHIASINTSSPFSYILTGDGWAYSGTGEGFVDNAVSVSDLDWWLLARVDYS